MLFKFTTTKPSAVEIWNTLYTYDFKPDQGYTTDQIRFICYCLFQLNDFNTNKKMVNKYLDGVGGISTLLTSLSISMSTNGVITLKPPPAGFPHFVDESLYIPYYMFMQLSVDVESELWFHLFDRYSIRDIYEQDYIIANQQPITHSITEYKLWSLKPSLDSIFKVFQIDETLLPVEVNTIHGVRSELQKYIHQYLDDTPIYDYSSPIIIPPFKLRSTDVS